LEDVVSQAGGQTSRRVKIVDSWAALYDSRQRPERQGRNLCPSVPRRRLPVFATFFILTGES